LELVPDAFISSSSDSGLPAEYKAASILAAISASGRGCSRKVCMCLPICISKNRFIILLLLTLVIVIVIVVVTLSSVKAGQVSS
jgi:hypothetical protein